MTKTLSPTGESSSHKMAAVFDDADQARLAQKQLGESIDLNQEQTDILEPGSRGKARRLLPESEGIWRTWLKAHAVFGAAGALIGMTAFLTLLLADVGVVSDNPVLAGLVFLHVPTLMGLLVGGLFSLRPDQSPYLYAARDALRSGKAVLVVHAESHDQLNSARQYLEQPSLATVRTI